ncbi:AlpA family transcriptional regulator [Magnetospirillum sp. UT-4]|uniref:helix-turn-helix transcriptional regulator n=1 Tax=Magnetospirillum sp. UT-4 TaxID=2681467 RepID=UPI0013859576|nr:helix-turn-helix domain-containing protein [Magnetospirillum sp. UT-4]CAA7615776.1 conserved hypothetical protein [Magnetospirillum sp. UT-4]
MTVKYLTQNDIAQRWAISPRTLERWRWLGIGPRYLKIRGRVRYRQEDIDAYEAEQVRGSTSATAPALGGVS